MHKWAFFEQNRGEKIVLQVFYRIIGTKRRNIYGTDGVRIYVPLIILVRICLILIGLYWKSDS